MSADHTTSIALLRQLTRQGIDGCVEWPRGRSRSGYGQLRSEDRTPWLAHRLAWTLTNGPIPDGLLVCHRCDNPPCVNPEHLFLGTHVDNMRDMVQKGRRQGASGNAVVAQAKTHCPAGHPYDLKNTYWHNRSRHCRSCNRAAVARLKERKKLVVR